MFVSSGEPFHDLTEEFLESIDLRSPNQGATFEVLVQNLT